MKKARNLWYKVMAAPSAASRFYHALTADKWRRSGWYEKMGIKCAGQVWKELLKRPRIGCLTFSKDIFNGSGRFDCASFFLCFFGAVKITLFFHFQLFWNFLFFEISFFFTQYFHFRLFSPNSTRYTPLITSSQHHPRSSWAESSRIV